jgi:uncharacterized protein
MEVIERSLIKTSVIIGACLIIVAGIIAYAMYQVKAADNALSVTGSAKQTVTSDLVKWNASFSRTVYATELKSGYTQMKSDENIVGNYLKTNGIADSELTISPISMNKQYNYDKSGNPGPDEYDLVQTVSVQSTDINKIAALSKSIQPIIDQGVIFSASAPEYYYTKLPDMRISLLPDAMKDAQKRALSIAQSTGKKIGNLESASMGVVQVLQPNSTDISDYGNYDTSTVQKMS